MKNEEFLQLLSGIDEKLIEKAGEALENYHKAETQYAAVCDAEKREDEVVLKPKYFREDSSSKFPFKRVMIAVAAAACIAALGVFIWAKSNPLPVSPNDSAGVSSGKITSETSGIPVTDNLDLSNAKIIENTPDNGKWRKMLYDFQKMDEQSADRIVNIAANYGAGEIDKNDIMLWLDVVGDGVFAPVSDFYEYLPRDYLTDEDFVDFPYIGMQYCSDDLYIEVQMATGGLVELDNRKNVNSILDLNIHYKAAWRPSFNTKSEAPVDLNDENATCILNGKTVKIVDAIKNAEKYISENDALFQKSFGAKVKDATLYTYENGNQSLSLIFEYTIDGVVLDGAQSVDIEDEDGNKCKIRPIMVQCGMLTENTLDWIWFPSIDGETEITSEECEITISREKACELVSQKLSQEYKFHVEEIQLMYAAELAETGKYPWEPAKSRIEPMWRFYITGIHAQEYHALYVYVNALDGEVQLAEAWG